VGHDVLLILITIAISIPAATLLTWLISSAIIGAQLGKKIGDIDERHTRRANRVDDVLPAMARGIFALLDFHLYGETNGSKETMQESMKELRDITTDKMVSQKATP
jgi:hypothetical protein